MLIKNALVTGCDFGLGLEFVKVLCQDENIKNVFAGYINLEKAPGLKKLVQENSKVTPVELNMVDDETIKKTKANVEAKVGNEGLDLLINNAGINIDDGYLEGTFGDTHLQGGPRRDLLMAHFNVNTVGPISKMTSKNMKQHLRHVLLWLYDENNQITSDEALGKIQQALLPSLKTAAKVNGRAFVVNISSDRGSVKQAKFWQSHCCSNISYGPSKAALNQFTRSLAFYESKNNVISIAVHPGWMLTPMGGPAAEVNPLESAEKIIKNLANLTVDDAGRYMNKDGEDMEF